MKCTTSVTFDSSEYRDVTFTCTLNHFDEECWSRTVSLKILTGEISCNRWGWRISDFYEYEPTNRPPQWVTCLFKTMYSSMVDMLRDGARLQGETNAV